MSTIATPSSTDRILIAQCSGSGISKVNRFIFTASIWSSTGAEVFAFPRLVEFAGWLFVVAFLTGIVISLS
jgi:hypothetical protein